MAVVREPEAGGVPAATSFKARGLKLDMGKSCVRFKSLDDLPLDVIGAVIAQHAATGADRRARSGAREEAVGAAR